MIYQAEKDHLLPFDGYRTTIKKGDYVAGSQMSATDWEKWVKLPRDHNHIILKASGLNVALAEKGLLKEYGRKDRAKPAK